MQPIAHEKFTESFKSMWEDGSKVRILWNLLEDLYQALLDECAKLDHSQTQSRNIRDIDEALRDGTRLIELLGPEFMALLWDRIVLRTHLKVRDAMRLLFYSSNTANAYGCALSARCIMEHVAVLQYLVDRVPWRLTRSVPKKELLKFTKKLIVLAQGSKTDWDKLISGGLRNVLSSGEWKRNMETGLPPVAQLLDALDAALLQRGRLNSKGEIKFLYAVLCDVVHPNWGGDFIYAPHMHRELRCVPSFDDHFKLCVVFFCPCTAELLAHLITTARDMEGDKLFAVWTESSTRGRT